MLCYFLLDNIRKFLSGVYTFPSHKFLTGSTLLDTNSLVFNSPQIHLENIGYSHNSQVTIMQMGMS